MKPNPKDRVRVSAGFASPSLPKVYEGTVVGRATVNNIFWLKINKVDGQPPCVGEYRSEIPFHDSDVLEILK